MFQVRGYISEVGFLDIVKLYAMPCQKMRGGNHEWNKANAKNI